MLMKHDPITALPPELVPEDYFQPLALDSVFSHRAPVEVDLGCGDGSFLAAMAQQNLERNFLGLERLLGRVRSACRKIAQVGLRNARVLRIESSYAVAHLFPPESISVFYLLFPDPWPKRRHHPRRLVSEKFLDSIFRTLRDDGLFVVATDDKDYFDQINRLTNESNRFSLGQSGELPITTFEKHFRARGLPIHRLALQKVSPEK
jgi:tRNA (guanine-N7-)-methyltransferase